MTADDFFADAWRRTDNRNKRWYQENLMPVLLEAKEQRARDIDTTIGLAKQLLEIYSEKIVAPTPAPVYEHKTSEDDNFMKPVEPEVLDLIYGSTEKGFGKRYFAKRNEKSPEDKYNFRLCTNWEYGWQRARVRERNVRGRCAVLRDTLYRRCNVAPDPAHYRPPAGEFSVCSQYSCHFS